ncbi:syntaxin-binding protein 5, partial [Mytilus galloprovincialis]
ITFCHLAFQSKWLYIGTERGNVHIVNIESFVLSGYVINWNKAIELSRKTHPGVVVHLSDNPVDPNKLLIGFESGTIVLWDLKSKQAEFRYNSPEALRSVSWHHEGKQFMCSHSDGSLTRYNVRQPPKYIDLMMPHAKTGRDGKAEPCKPIAKVEWKSVKNSEPLVMFSGGMSYDRAGRTPTITVMNGKSTTVLEMEHNIVDFVVLCETPWVNDFQEPYAIVVLLQNDLVNMDHSNLVNDSLDQSVSSLDQSSSSLDQSSLSMDTSAMTADYNRDYVEIEGPILSSSNFQFNLTTPSPMPAYLNVHYICESASRLLFLSMHWTRSIQAFQALSQDIQTVLVKSCWSELFTLGLAQCSQTMSLPTILMAILNHLQTALHQDKTSAERIKIVIDHILKLQNYIQSMHQLNVDTEEYAYLKALVLFSPDNPSLLNAPQIEKIQDMIQQELRQHVERTHPSNPDRLPKLLLRLPPLHGMTPSIMEELFFAGLIGNVQIDSIIPYILRMETAEYNSQMAGQGLLGSAMSNDGNVTMAEPIVSSVLTRPASSKLNSQTSTEQTESRQGFYVDTSHALSDKSIATSLNQLVTSAGHNIEAPQSFYVDTSLSQNNEHTQNQFPSQQQYVEITQASNMDSARSELAQSVEAAIGSHAAVLLGVPVALAAETMATLQPVPHSSISVSSNGSSQN